MPKRDEKGKKSSMRRRGKKREIVFDPEARKAYLRGFSERKRQRRAYGLAMQKVKDRKSKIEQRAQEKKDKLEQVEEAERQKAELMEEVLINSGAIKEGDDDDDSDNENENENEDKTSQDGDDKDGNKKKKEVTKKSDSIINTKQYDDTTTQKQWGGQVTVTTSVVDLGDDSSDDDDYADLRKDDKKSVDLQQRYAGNVDKYMTQLKGNMPSKKREHSHQRRKGMNGAADMKGMGGSGNLKIAQKILGKAKNLQKGAPGGGGGGKKRKGKKGRR